MAGIAVIDAPFNRSTLFVVIPGHDQQIRRGILRTIIMPEDAQSVFKGLSAPVRYFTIAAPGRLGVVKAWPDGAHCDLVGMMLSHVGIEVIEIISAPVTAVRRPSCLSGLNPGIVAIEGPRIFVALVLVDQERRIRPRLRNLAHAVPIGAGIFRKDKDYR